MYREQAMNRQAIGKWCKQFEKGRTELQDKAGKGRRQLQQLLTNLRALMS